MIDVNIHGVLNGIATLLPRFIEQQDGHIINVASIAARIVMPTSSSFRQQNTRCALSPRVCGKNMT